LKHACGFGNVFCEPGSLLPRAVEAGNYSIGGNTTDKEIGQTACEAGFYCVGGVRTACPHGTWSAASQSFCSLCSAGHFGNTTAAAISATCDGLCAAGYWCEAGSSSMTQHVCGGPNVYCPAGSTAPLAVASGNYSAPVSLASNIRYEELPCEAGYYCIDGVRIQCPLGLWSNAGNSTCDLCAAGVQALFAGHTNETCDGACPAGFW
jgi:hypothetical protein